MDFFTTFLGKLHHYNSFSKVRMPLETCIANLNMAISADDIFKCKVVRIKLNKIHCNCGVAPKATFLDILKQVHAVAIQLDSGKMLMCGSRLLKSRLLSVLTVYSFMRYLSSVPNAVIQLHLVNIWKWF